MAEGELGSVELRNLYGVRPWTSKTLLYLRRAGFRTLAEVAQETEAQLDELNGIGPHRLAEIREGLEAVGLRLRKR